MTSFAIQRFDPASGDYEALAREATASTLTEERTMTPVKKALDDAKKEADKTRAKKEVPREGNIGVPGVKMRLVDHLEPLVDTRVVLDVHHVEVLHREGIAQRARHEEAATSDGQDHVRLVAVIGHHLGQAAHRRSIRRPVERLAFFRHRSSRGFAQGLHNQRRSTYTAPTRRSALRGDEIRRPVAFT